MGSGIECILSSFMDGTERGGAVDTLEERDCIPRDLGRLESWGCVSPVEFNEAKGKVLHLDQSSSKHKQRGRAQAESSPEENDLGHWWMKSWT